VAAKSPRSVDDPELSHNGKKVTLDTLRGERREEILRLAERRGARNVRVFGSVARGESGEDSDLDLLVAWEPGRSLLDHAGLVQDLQELLGIRVHVGTEKSLHWYVRDRILREATISASRRERPWSRTGSSSRLQLMVSGF
jgi:predicted nucleotidyltransferase